MFNGILFCTVNIWGTGAMIPLRKLNHAKKKATVWVLHAGNFVGKLCMFTWIWKAKSLNKCCNLETGKKKKLRHAPSSKWETLMFALIHQTSQYSLPCMETAFKNVKMVLLRIMLDCFHDLAILFSFKLMHTSPSSHEQLVWHCVVWETYSGWKGLPL